MDHYSDQESRRAREEAKGLVKEALKELLDERDALDKERHRTDHEFVAVLRRKQENREKFWEKTKSSVVGGVILMCVGGVVSFLIWVGNLWLNSRGPTAP